MRFLIFTLCASLIATATAADTFRLNFGGGQIGSLTASPTNIRSDITSAPMGVGNGQFTASLQNARTNDGVSVVQYLSNSPSKGRTISVLYKGSAVIETSVSPTGDRTNLSDVSAVPNGVISPVEALDRLISARGCPASLQFYDGRRVISVSATGSSRSDATLQCDMSYRVTHGPGHLSPLYIKNASLQIFYDVAGAQSLTQMSISSGPFTLNVVR